MPRPIPTSDRHGVGLSRISPCSPWRTKMTCLMAPSGLVAKEGGKGGGGGVVFFFFFCQRGSPQFAAPAAPTGWSVPRWHDQRQLETGRPATAVPSASPYVSLAAFAPTARAAAASRARAALMSCDGATGGLGAGDVAERAWLARCPTLFGYGGEYFFPPLLLRPPLCLSLPPSPRPVATSLRVRE